MGEKILVIGAIRTLESAVAKQYSKDFSEINSMAASHSLENINKVQYTGVRSIQMEYDIQERLFKISFYYTIYE